MSSYLQISYPWVPKIIPATPPVESCGVQELSDVRRKHLYYYAEYHLSLGKYVSNINAELRTVWLATE